MCQNVGFGASILRPPSQFNKSTEEFIRSRNEETFLLNFLRSNSHFQNKVFPKIKAVATDMDGTITGGTPDSENKAIDALISLLDVVDRVYIVSINEFKNVEKKIISRVPVDKRHKVSVFSGRGTILTEFDNSGSALPKTTTLGVQYIQDRFLTEAQLKEIEAAVNSVAIEYDQYVKDDGPKDDRTWRARYPGFYEGYYIDSTGRNTEDKPKFDKRDEKGNVVSIRRIIQEGGLGYVDMVIAQIPSKKYALNGIDDERLEFIEKVKAKLPADILALVDISPEFSAAVGVRKKGVGKSGAMQEILKSFKPEEVIYFGNEFWEGGMDWELAEQFPIVTVAVDKEQSKIHPKAWGSVGGTINADATIQWMIALLENKTQKNGTNFTEDEERVVKHVLEMFRIRDFSSLQKLLDGHGSQFRPVRFQVSSGKSYVLRQEKKSIAEMRFIVSVMNRLAALDFPVPKLLSKTTDPKTDDYFIQYNGAFYLVEEFLQNGTTVRTANLNKQQFIEMGALAARINNALEGFQPDGEKFYRTREQIYEDLKREFIAFYKETDDSKYGDQNLIKAFRSNYTFFIDQLEKFRKEYDQSKLRSGIIFADLHAGNLKFDESGKIVGLVDFDFVETDKRIVEFNNMVLGNDDPRAIGPYAYEKLQAMLISYNKEAKVHLSEDEVRAVVEVLRLRLLEDIFQHFIENKPDAAFHTIDQIEQEKVSLDTIETLWLFNQDFGTEDQIRLFIEKVNSDLAMIRQKPLWEKYKDELKSRQPVDISKMVVSMSHQQGEQYKQEVMRLLTAKGLTCVTPDILFEAAINSIREEETSKIEGRIALQPGSMNPYTNGHLSVSLAGILSADLGGAIVATAGLIPEKPYALSAKLRYWMTQLAVKDVFSWVRVASVRDDVFQAFRDEDLSLWGNNRAEQVRMMDMAGFIWLFRSNPNIKWVYLAGSDKVADYPVKNEVDFIKEVLHDKVHAKVLYFLRDQETRESLYNKIKSTPWVENLWREGFFQQSNNYPTPADIAANKIKRQIIQGKRAGDLLSPALTDILAQYPEIGKLYELEIAISDIETKLTIAIAHAKSGEISVLYKEWSDHIEELAAMPSMIIDGQEVFPCQLFLLGDNKSRMSNAVTRVVQGALNDVQIDWLIKRVQAIHGVKINDILRLRIRAVLSEKNITDFTRKTSEIWLRDLTDDEKQVFRLVESEAEIFHNGTVDEDGFGVNVLLDKEAEKKMKSARAAFGRKKDQLKKLSRKYWDEELSQYRGDVKSFNDDKRISQPKISIGIVSLFDRRFNSLMRRLDELGKIQNKEQIELVITMVLVDSSIENNNQVNCNQKNWEEMEKKIKSIGIPTKVIFTKKNTITTNRNLAASLSNGKYQVFIDDDVSLVGPVVERMVDALEKYEELGMVSVAAYNQKILEDGKIVKRLYKPRFTLKHFKDDQFNLAFSNMVLGMATATRRDILEANPFLRFLGNLGDDIHFMRQVHMLGFLGGYVLDNDAYIIDEQVGAEGASATKAQINIYPYFIEEGLAYYLNQATYGEYEHRRAVLKTYTFGRGTLSREDAGRLWKEFSDALIEFLNDDVNDIQINTSGLSSEIRERVNNVVTFFKKNKAAINEYKEKEYDSKNLSQINTFFGMLKYSQDPPAYFFLNKKLVERRLESWENELARLFNATLGLLHSGKDLFTEQERADREKRYRRAFEIEEEIKAAVKIISSGRSPEIDDVRQRLLRAQWVARRLAKESFLFSLEDSSSITVVPFEQLNRFGERSRNHHIALYPGLYLTDGLAISEAQNPKDHRQNNHLHDSQEMTVALSGDIRVARIGSDGKDIDVLAVPAGSMIKVAPNTLHRIDNPNKDAVSADFTIKAPLVQMQKAFEYSIDASPDAVKVIAPMEEVLDNDRGKILTYFYPGQAHLLDIDSKTQQMNLDSENMPQASGDAYFKVRVVYLRAGEKSDLFVANPVYDNFQAVRVFPWPEKIEPDWVLERDRENLTGQIEVLDQDLRPLKISNFKGGDLLVIRGLQQQKEDNRVVSRFRITNSSGKSTLIFAVVEKMSDDDRLLPDFLRTLTITEKLQNIVSLHLNILKEHGNAVAAELAEIYNELHAKETMLKNPSNNKYLERLLENTDVLQRKLIGIDNRLLNDVQRIKKVIEDLLGREMNLEMDKDNYFLAVFIDQDLMSAAIKITPLIRKYAVEYLIKNGHFPTLNEVKDFVQTDKEVLGRADYRKIEQIPDLVIISGVTLDKASEDRISTAKEMFNQMMTVPFEQIDNVIRKLREPGARRSAIIALKWMANVAELDGDGYRMERDRARRVLIRFSEMFFSEFEGKKMLDAFSDLVRKKILDKTKQGAKPEEILVVPLLTSGEQIGQYVGNRIYDTNVITRPLLFTTAMTIAFGREVHEKIFRANMFTSDGKENTLRYLRQEGILNEKVRYIFFIDTGMTGSFGKLLNFTLKDQGVSGELLLIDHADYNIVGIEKEWAHGLNDEEAWQNKEKDLRWMCIMLDHIFEHSEESPSDNIEGLSGGRISVIRRPTHHQWFAGFVKQEFDRIAKQEAGAYIRTRDSDIDIQNIDVEREASSASTDSAKQENKNSVMLSKELKTMFADSIKIIENVDSSELERKDAQEKLESLIEIAREHIMYIERAVREKQVRNNEINALLQELKAGKFKLKGESVDILSAAKESARTIGTIDRKIAETLGYVHQTANVIFLTPSNEILLQLRNKSNFDDHLAMIGGHLKAGENHLQGAITEASEETGLDIAGDDLIFIGYEYYDVSFDSNKEKRSWYVKKLSPEEYGAMKRKLEEQVDSVYASKLTNSRAQVKEKLKSLWDEGKGEVLGYYPVLLNDIENAHARESEEKGPYQGRLVRHLPIEDTFNGEVKSIDAFFSPDSLDRLIDNKGIIDNLKRVMKGLNPIDLDSAMLFYEDPIIDKNKSLKTEKLYINSLIDIADFKKQNFTFAILKPDVTDIMQEQILKDIRTNGFEIVYIGNPRRYTKEEAEKHYMEHKGKPFYEGLVQYIISGEVVPLILRKADSGNAIEEFKKLVGKSDGTEINTLRNRYGVSPTPYKGINIQYNKIHASDSMPIVLREASLIFTDEELKNIFDRDLYLLIKERLSLQDDGILKGSISIDDLLKSLTLSQKGI